jgi:hypothetical protein
MIFAILKFNYLKNLMIMKKITILFAVFFIGFMINVNAQTCTPSHPGYTTVPDTGVMLPIPLPNATINVAYQQAITIGAPSSVEYNGMSVTMNWIKFNHITSSLGNTWTVVNETGGTTFPQWNAGVWACVTLSGTPTIAGTDTLTVFVDANVPVLGTQTNQPGGKLPIIIQTGSSIGAEYIDSQVSVYPNPSNGNFTINVYKEYNMSVYDITGRVIYTKLINDGASSIDLSKHNSGIYFVRLTNDNESKVIRVVKR